MHLTVNSDFAIFGKQPQKSFTTNFFYAWEDEVPEHEGKLYINFSLENGAIDGEEFAQELFETVRHHYFQKFERDLHERFEETLNEVNKLATLWKEEKHVKFFPNIHCVIGIIQGNDLLLTQCGNAEAYLIRRRHLTLISEELSDADKERENLFVNVASGELEDYDTVLFSTDRLIRYISKAELAKLFSKEIVFARAFQMIEDLIATELDNQINLLGLNIIHNKVEEEVEDDKDQNYFSFLKNQTSTLLSKFSKKKSEPLENGLDKEMERKIETSVVNRRKTNMLKTFNFSDIRNDKLLLSLVCIIALLIVGLFVLKTRLVRQKELTTIEKQLDSVQMSVNEAETRGSYDKETAVKMLDEAQKNVRSVLESGEFRQRALSLQDAVEEARDALDNVVKVTDPVVLADLVSKRSTVNLLGILPLNDALYAYEYNALYPILLDKALDPLSIDQNESVIDGVRSIEDKALLLLTKSHKVIKFNDNFITFMDTQDPAWKEAVAIEAFGDKLYLLDTTGNKIWRYRKGKERYSGAEEYASSGDVTNAVDFAIDGAVYVLKKDGTITKYYAGEIETNFKILRAPMVPIKNATKIFTEPEFSQIYILEPSASRLLTYNKDAKTGNLVYSHQYQFDPTLGTLKDVYVDKIGKKINVTTDTRVFQIEM